MKFTVQIQSGQRTAEHVVEFASQDTAGRSTGRMKFVMDGEPGETDWAEVEPGIYSLLDGCKSIVVTLCPGTDAAVIAYPLATEVAYEVFVFGQNLRANIVNPRRMSRSGATGVHDVERGIVASMPGRIAKILVAENTSVAKGDGLLIIEAMKMQNEIRSPRSGRVAKIYVREGEGVETGAKLVTFG